MLLGIIDDKKKLLALLAVLYIFSYLAQLHVVYPIEQMLDFEITKHASIVYLPAGFVFLSFTFLVHPVNSDYSNRDYYLRLPSHCLGCI